MDSLLPIAIVTVLILLNGLFVAAEFAIVGAPRASIDRLAAQGNRVARMVHQILEDPRQQDRYIATAQLGITFASLGLGMYGEHMLAEWLAYQLEAWGAARWIAAHALASVLAIAILTYFHIVVGEMVPKALALQYAERTALRVTPPMLWTKTLLYPLVVGLNALGNGVLRLLGIRREMDAAHYHTPQELQYIIRESQEGGLLQEDTGRVLRDLFQFGDLTAGGVMTPRVRVTGIPLEATPGEVRAIVGEALHTRYPVYQGDLDHIVGLVHIKDVLRLLLHRRPVTSGDVRRILRVPETTQLDTALAMMRGERVQMAVVMDEHGGTAGIMTIEDLFEEVVGDIEEGTAHRPSIYTDPDGRTHCEGTVRLEELGEHLGSVIEHDEVETVSGLVLTLLERVPEVGDTVVYEGILFEVVAVEGHGVGECVVLPPDGDEE